jgi:hypothetical protein
MFWVPKFWPFHQLKKAHEKNFERHGPLMPRQRSDIPQERSTQTAADWLLSRAASEAYGTPLWTA